MAVTLLTALVLMAEMASRLWLTASAEQRIALPLVAGCPLHLQACRAELPGGGVLTFEITPKQPNPAEAIVLVARFEGVEPEAVQVSFEGKEMYMGYLSYPLRRQQELADALQFSGRGSLSICIRSLMEWVAKVEVQLGEVIYEVPFEFETLHQ
jgi:hypothetical protein